MWGPGEHRGRQRRWLLLLLCCCGLGFAGQAAGGGARGALQGGGSASELQPLRFPAARNHPSPGRQLLHQPHCSSASAAALPPTSTVLCGRLRIEWRGGGAVRRQLHGCVPRVPAGVSGPEPALMERGGPGSHPVQALLAASVAAVRRLPLLARVVKDQLAAGRFHLPHLVGHGAERLPSPVGAAVDPARHDQRHSGASAAD